MRAVLFLLGILTSALASAQAGGNLFTSTRPDVSITVTKHSSGADVLEVTMQKANYPEALLREQVGRLAEGLGTTPTGLKVGTYQVGSDANLRFTQATFAVQGLVDRAGGILRVEPIAKAFAGTPEPNTVDVLMVQFEGERPTENTLRGYYPENGPVRVQAVSGAVGGGVEYRIQLLTQDPTKISIPDDRRKPPAQAAPAAPKPAPGPDWLLYAVILIAAIAVGALVYSLLLRGRPRAGRI
jgi:hypothetical protein